MADDFDAYYQWLGIRPKDQPPNHYRLLGLDLFESDPNVIENAADRQMAHLRTFQTGPHGELSQKLLNEISTARVCLLKPDAKADYDRQLKAETDEEEAASRSLEPVDEPTPSSAQSAISTSAWLDPQFGPPASHPQQAAGSGFVPPTMNAAQPRRQQPLWQQPIVVAGSLVGLVLLSLIVYVSTRGDRDDPIAVVDKSKSQQKTPRSKPPAKKTVLLPPLKKDATPPPPVKKKDGSKKTKTGTPKTKAKENGSKTTVDPSPKNPTVPLSRDEANRKALRFVIKHGGYSQVWQMRDGRRRQTVVRRVEEIPRGPFDIDSVAIMTKTEFTVKDLRVLAGLAELRQLDLGGMTIDNDLIRGLQDLPRLSQIKLIESQITHDCVSHLGRFKALRTFSLFGGSFGDEGVSKLVRRLPRLSTVELSNTKVTDVGVAQLKLLSELESVSLSRSAVTDRSAVYLAECTKLRKINLSETAIGDDALKALARLPILSHLNIANTNITENGLAALAGARILAYLSLDSVKLTETGFGHLRQIKGLKSVSLPNCGVTVERAGQLQKMLPGCRIQGVRGYRSPN